MLLLGFLCIVIFLWRYFLLKQITGVRTRDLKLLTAIRKVRRLLCAAVDDAKFDPSKDRAAYVPGMSRRKKLRPLKQDTRNKLLKKIKFKRKASTPC
jgi:hypothetical protein